MKRMNSGSKSNFCLRWHRGIPPHLSQANKPFKVPISEFKPRFSDKVEELRKILPLSKSPLPEAHNLYIFAEKNTGYPKGQRSLDLGANL